LLEGGELAVLVEADEAVTCSITVAAPDRVGLFATIAGVLALNRLSVRSAQVRTEQGMALDVWSVVPQRDHEPRADALKRDILRVQSGELDLTRQLDTRDASRRAPVQQPPPPRVDEIMGASEVATVLEVRAHDRPGLLYRLGRALAIMGLSIRAARVTTLGSEAVDTFYVVDGDGRQLDPAVVREASRLLVDAGG
jgi:[protein-PII] uridylyltransferase